MSYETGDNIYYVYEWYNIDTGEVFYVGKGKGRRCSEIKYRNNYFKNYYNKHKKDCDYRIIADKLYEDDAFILERDVIKSKRKIGQAKCNLSDGGEGSSFDHISKKAKALYFAIISSNRKGHSSSWDLKKHKLRAINNCIEKYDILDHQDIFEMDEDEINDIYDDYIEFSENELDNIIGYKMFCEAVIDGYDSMDDFWECN